jgi:FkbM family methyltransferase
MLHHLDLKKGIYVDIGANHPTRISNTYLFYRHGFKGVVIEPNMRLLFLHRWFRPRDISIGVGCGSEATLKYFTVASHHVYSSFDTEHDLQVQSMDVRVLRKELVPVMPLDLILDQFKSHIIYFLSIDTEGAECDVLRGSLGILKRAMFLCIEIANAQEEAEIRNLLQNSFIPIRHIGCNLILKNSKFEELAKILMR